MKPTIKNRTRSKTAAGGLLDSIENQRRKSDNKGNKDSWQGERGEEGNRGWGARRRGAYQITWPTVTEGPPQIPESGKYHLRLFLALLL